MKYTLFFVALTFGFTSCGGRFLDVKPDKSMVVPSTLSDLQGILDNSTVMNMSFGNLDIISADPFLVSESVYNSLTSLPERNGFTWAVDIFENDKAFHDWKSPYQAIFYSNLVLSGLENIEDKSNSNEYKNVEGSAYFFRSWAYYQLAQLFCKPYSIESTNFELGLPLKIEPDITIRSERSSLKETYERIINDAKSAVRLLNGVVPITTRPSKQAAFALLSKVYLEIGDYKQSLLYSDSCLSINNTLLDYAELNTSVLYPFVQFENPEVIFFSSKIGSSILHPSRYSVDSAVYDTYSQYDRRKSLYFSRHSAGHLIFTGSYNGNDLNFNGLTTREMVFVKAECLARLGQSKESSTLLKALLLKRYTSLAEISFDSINILQTILDERKKEFFFTGIHWSDLRRLNKEPRFARQLIRNVGKKEFNLQPNDKRYTLSIPNLIVDFSDMEQNNRD